jgi:hypothetical protein
VVKNKRGFLRANDFYNVFVALKIKMRDGQTVPHRAFQET